MTPFTANQSNAPQSTSSQRKAVICYDISCPKQARAMRKLLGGYRLGGQKSVCQCWLTPKQALTITNAISAFLDNSSGRWALIWVDPYRPVIGLHQGEQHMFQDTPDELCWRIS